MRLSEKSIEINFCAEATVAMGLQCHPFWCGLTQKQEANLGFDVAGRRGGRMLIYQFKASNQFVRGVRKFTAPHNQLKKLRKLATGPNQVFYVFPDIGTTDEFVSANNLTSRTWLCDVYQPGLKSLGPPHRKSGHHSVELHVNGSQKFAWWHSDPVKAEVVRADRWFSHLSDRLTEVGRGVNIDEPNPWRSWVNELRARKTIGLSIL